MSGGGGILGALTSIGLGVAGVVTGQPELIAAGLTGAVSSYTGMQQQKAQDKANKTADANAKAELDAQTQAQNKANAKSPNVAALFSQNKTQSLLGNTDLTGGGVNANSLQLGKNTLLGQ